MFGAVVRLIKQVPQAFGSILGVRGGVEEPAHTVEQLASGVELRGYGPRIAAETTVTGDDEAARSAGFRCLAGYIFGGNHAATEIAMTAPVVQQASRVRGETISMTAPVSQSAVSSDQWVIRFFMPAGRTMKSLPEPNNGEVRLVRVPAETLAVRRFSGSNNHRAISFQTDQLMRTLRDTGFEPIGTPAAWFYDPPWTLPMLRRNEIAVAVQANS